MTILVDIPTIKAPNDCILIAYLVLALGKLRSDKMLACLFGHSQSNLDALVLPKLHRGVLLLVKITRFDLTGEAHPLLPLQFLDFFL